MAKTVVAATAAATIAFAAAAAYHAWILRKRRRCQFDGDDHEEHRTTAHAEFVRLASRVRDVSEGKLRLIDTADRGRCLVAAEDLPAGTRVRDMPVAPHGSSRGMNIGSLVDPELQEAKCFSSSDLLAAIDFLASLAKSIAHGENCKDDAPIWSMYRFAGEAEPVPMIRRWLPHINSGLVQEVPLETLEAAWQHVVPNWRRLVASTPYGSWIEDVHGSPQLALGHETICGLWLLMALCEHSCDPSCALVHDAKDLWITTLRPVAAGEAVTTSYMNLEGLRLDVQTRQQQLQEAWRFTCTCSRCLRELATGVSKTAADQGTKDETSVESFQAVLQRCRSPPSEKENQRLAYCSDLREVRAAARQVHGQAVDPAIQSLLLLEAIFAPDGHQQEEACRELLETCRSLQGDVSVMADRARGLLEDPSSFLRGVISEGNAMLVGDGGEMKVESDQVENSATRRAIRVLYRRHLVARAWPRRRVGLGQAYVASATAAVKRTTKTAQSRC